LTCQPNDALAAARLAVRANTRIEAKARLVDVDQEIPVQTVAADGWRLAPEEAAAHHVQREQRL
jgi:hypothetical protein